jgi:hypothetical protein
MNAEQIKAKILGGIASLGAIRLNYLSGSNHISDVTIEAGNRITATRGVTKHISIAFEKLDSIAAGLTTGNPVNVDAVFQGSGNARSALETILAHLPNIGFLPANKSPNKGPKKIVWFNDEIHPLGQVLDACELMLNRGARTTGTAALGEADQLVGMTQQFEDDANTAYLRVDHRAFHRLASSLLSKRFLIATGLAGSGKTKLAQAFARWLTTQDACYEVVPVGADWTGNENVLGYPNGLDKETYISKPALDLIIHAGAHEDVPHFLILDEMNLSHVERYFADILSVIESEEGIQLYDGAARKANGNPIPSSVELPKNLFIIGTVNVDETTYMFSPKVLDRANVIEFRMDAGELGGFLGNPAKPVLSKLDGKGASFGKAFVDAAKNPVAVPVDVKPAYDAEMLLLFKTLQAHGAEFGYRTAYETARFIHFYKLLGNHADGDATWFPSAFDCVVFQKLLPKLHGSRAKLGPVLKKLWFLCVNDAAGRGADALKAAEEAARSTDKKAEPSVVVPAGAPYPLSAEKIGRMWRLLIENGFASFAEA